MGRFTDFWIRSTNPRKGSQQEKGSSKGAGKGKEKQRGSETPHAQSKGSTEEPEWKSFMVDHKAPGFELRSPKNKLPLWKKRAEFMDKLQEFELMIAKCPTGSGKSTMLPMLAVQMLKPNAGRVICTQIRRATTQSVWKSTCDVWAINRDDGKFVGFRHGTEKTENWDKRDTKVLFVTEGIIMRQVLGHDDENSGLSGFPLNFFNHLSKYSTHCLLSSSRA